MIVNELLHKISFNRFFQILKHVFCIYGTKGGISPINPNKKPGSSFENPGNIYIISAVYQPNSFFILAPTSVCISQDLILARPSKAGASSANGGASALISS